jgi:hypothetical protein
MIAPTPLRPRSAKSESGRAGTLLVAGHSRLCGNVRSPVAELRGHCHGRQRRLEAAENSGARTPHNETSEIT